MSYGTAYIQLRIRVISLWTLARFPGLPKICSAKGRPGKRAIRASAQRAIFKIVQLGNRVTYAHDLWIHVRISVSHSVSKFFFRIFFSLQFFIDRMINLKLNIAVLLHNENLQINAMFWTRMCLLTRVYRDCTFSSPF